MTSSSTPHLLSDLVLYLRVCGQAWAVIYLAWSLVFTSWSLHLMVIGLCVCVFSYFRLPPPSPALVHAVLGPDIAQSQDDADWVVAHRAACLDGPENSLEAVRLAASNGAKWVEFDVSFTSDGTAVAFHDDTLDRVTTGSGPITQVTFSQLNKLDLAVKHPLSANFNGVRIPKVEDFVAECLKHKMKVIIDLKTWESPEETLALVTSLYEKMPELKTNALVTSFFPHLLYKLRSSNPDILCSVSTRPHFLAFSTYDGHDEGMRPRFTGLKQVMAQILDCVFPWLLHNVIWWTVGLSAVLVHKAVVTKQYVTNWKRKGVRVMAWTVNSPLEKAAMRHIVGIQVLSDSLERLPQDRLLPRI